MTAYMKNVENRIQNGLEMAILCHFDISEILSNSANLSLEIGPFHDFGTFFHLAESSNLKLDIFRHTGQPLEFYFRGGAWGVPLATTLIHWVPGYDMWT